MSLEQKAVEVLERAGMTVTSLPCQMCMLYRSDMFVNVKCAGFDYKHHKDTDKLTEKFMLCLVNPAQDEHQSLKDLFQIVYNNRVEILGGDYTFEWTAEPCSHFQDRRLDNFRVLIEFEKGI